LKLKIREMNLKKEIAAISSIILLMILQSCGDGNVIVLENPSVQFKKDLAIITNYLADLGFEGDEIDTTKSGVRYVILDAGDPNLVIEESDIVSYHYIGRLANDTIFDTTIQEVADSIRAKVNADTVGKKDLTEHYLILDTFLETKKYDSIDFTYSKSGWTVTQFIPGFKEGLIASFDGLGVGGGTLIAIPSSQGYGANATGLLIPANAVLIFELYPIAITKQ